MKCGSSILIIVHLKYSGNEKPNQERNRKSFIDMQYQYGNVHRITAPTADTKNRAQPRPEMQPCRSPILTDAITLTNRFWEQGRGVERIGEEAIEGREGRGGEEKKNHRFLSLFQYDLTRSHQL